MKNIYFGFKWIMAILFVAFLLIVSCKKDGTSKPIGMRVNFFKQTAPYAGLYLSVQEKQDFDTNSWHILSSEIIGFSYEPGYVYDLLLQEVKLSQAADGPAYGYELKKVLSKKKVSADATFDLLLKTPVIYSPQQFFNYVTGSANSGFNLVYDVKIDCGSLCNELEQALKVNNAVTGIFRLNSDGSIKLVGLN